MSLTKTAQLDRGRSSWNIPITNHRAMAFESGCFSPLETSTCTSNLSNQTAMPHSFIASTNCYRLCGNLITIDTFSL
ncbi:hypothetical protein SCLCIDRAFT_1220025 [Scleroderma citrinum Foug A]|uniref:Uncharacterized protein n=1 Tax=Scleroderma citrinum Foug A TaxID=1036808 RepID=A0A0C3DL11_9AGAM|nr:hypothetical protein SCLCIDRAFT_1220025 [Scleroderma citrinum Foug A]